MLDSLGTVLASLFGVVAVWISAWFGRRAYTRIKADRDRIAANQEAVDAATRRAIEARRKADMKSALDVKRRDEFDRQP